MPEISPHNGNDLHSSTGCLPDSKTCAACGDTSHILLPLADLLKAVASTLQNQTPHNHDQDPELSGIDFEKQSINDGAKQLNESLLRNHVTSHWKNHVQSRLWRSFEPKTEPASEAVHKKENQKTPIDNGEAAESTAQAAVPASNDAPGDGSESDQKDSDCKIQPEVMDRECSPSEAVAKDQEHGTAEPKKSKQSPGWTGSWTNILPFPLHAHKKAEGEEGFDDDGEVSFKQPRFKQWHGLDGIAVMLFGVVFPALILAGGCASVPKRLTLILLNHPVETSVQILLLALVPITNYTLWSALRKEDVRFSIKRGIALGSAMITSLFICGIAVAALFNDNGIALETEIGTSFITGFTWLAALSFAAAFASAYVVRSFQRTCDFSNSRKRIASYTAIGALLTASTLLISEGQNFYIRIAERLAVSSNKEEQAKGLEILRSIYNERNLRLECSDSRAVGLSGLFLPIKATPQQELYFRLTGKPFSFKDEHNDMSLMPDDYVARHAVGDKIDGLSLVRSEMSASVKPALLATAVDWTFVFGNESSYGQQPRTEISTPPGAVITQMTEWVNGQPVQAVFTGGKNQQDTSWNSATSAAVTDLGHGRALLRCSEVPPGNQLKISVRMIVPLKPESMKSSGGKATASLLLPKLIATNYSVANDNKVQLYSPLKVTSDFAELKSRPANGVERLVGSVEGKRLESAEILVTVERPEPAPVAVLDKTAVRLAQEDARHLAAMRRQKKGQNTPLPQQLTVIVDGRQGIQTQLEQLTANLNQHRDKHGLKPVVKTVKPEFLVQTITQVKSKAPKHLLIVLDGSESMKPHIKELKNALKARSIPVEHVDLMIASEDRPELCKKVSLADGIKLLDEKNFKGGQNNLKTVIDAAEEVGSSQGGALLWIHGPQPITSGQIYITTPYAAHPSLYELPIENGEIDTAEFFKNHSDIGEFMQVSHKANLDKDIACFFEKWQPDNIDYVVAMTASSKKPEKGVELKESEAKELLQLNAYQRAMKFLAEHKDGAAARIAVAYGVLTPVSSLVIEQNTNNARSTEQSTDQAIIYGNTASADAESDSSAAPQLQGATNGTIGPQGADATYVCGVNTAGTVRVNNLANLEALLNIIANASEILLSLLGIAIAGSAFSQAGRTTFGRRIALGVILLIMGLSTPGVINWLVASARDANLFS